MHRSLSFEHIIAANSHLRQDSWYFASLTKCMDVIHELSFYVRYFRVNAQKKMHSALGWSMRIAQSGKLTGFKGVQIRHRRYRKINFRFRSYTYV